MILELDFITNKEESNKNESILLEMLKTNFFLKSIAFSY